MLAYWDANLICRFANKAYKTWFGIEPEHVMGQSMQDLLGPTLFELNQPYIQGALRGEPQTSERIIPGRDGVQRHSQASYNPDIVDGVVRGFAVQVTEVTHFKKVEAQLRESRRQIRSMAASREDALEQERKSIARELHDELGQLLTGLKMDLSVLKMQCDKQPKALDLIGDMNAVVERTFEVVRSVATSLRPSVLNIGLVPALEWLVEDFSFRWGLPCVLKIHGTEQSLKEGSATAVFRVVQESLTNIARHAKAQHAWVDLHFGPGYIKVTVQDDGQGFDTDQVREPHGFGLLGMQERMLAIRGEFQLDSHPGKGCTISIVVPHRQTASEPAPIGNSPDF